VAVTAYRLAALAAVGPTVGEEVSWHAGLDLKHWHKAPRGE